MTDIRFRRASPDDADEILEIKRAAIEDLEHWQYSPEQVQAWAPKDSYLDTFEQAIANDRFIVHVGEEDGEIIGYGALNVPDERIDAVYILPEHHGKGVATVLVKQLELSAEFQGLLELDVMAAQNAVPFYKSVGYWPLEDEVTTIDDVDLELVHMNKRLDPVDPDECFDADDEDTPPNPEGVRSEVDEWFDAEPDVDVDEWFDPDADGDDDEFDDPFE